jgi:hypothetical protein
LIAAGSRLSPPAAPHSRNTHPPRPSHLPRLPQVVRRGCRVHVVPGAWSRHPHRMKPTPARYQQPRHRTADPAAPRTPPRTEHGRSRSQEAKWPGVLGHSFAGRRLRESLKDAAGAPARRATRLTAVTSRPKVQAGRRIRPVIPRIGDGGGRPRVTGTVAGWTRSCPRLATASSGNRAAVQAVWCPCGGCVETGATAGSPARAASTPWLAAGTAEPG